MVISAAGKINHDKFVDDKKSCINLPTGKKITVRKQLILLVNIVKKKIKQIHLAIGFEGIDFIMKIITRS